VARLEFEVGQPWYSIYKLNQTAEKYNFEMSPTKMKIKDPVRYKTIINGNILKQVYNFNYLGCNYLITDGDVQAKLARFQVMCGTIRRVLGKQTRKAT
jgi:hypothetical protein